MLIKSLFPSLLQRLLQMTKFLQDMPEWMEGIKKSLQKALDALPFSTQGSPPNSISIYEAIEVSSVNQTAPSVLHLKLYPIQCPILNIKSLHTRTIIQLPVPLLIICAFVLAGKIHPMVALGFTETSLYQGHCRYQFIAYSALHTARPGLGQTHELCVVSAQPQVIMNFEGAVREGPLFN